MRRELLLILSLIGNLANAEASVTCSENTFRAEITGSDALRLFEALNTTSRSIAYGNLKSFANREETIKVSCKSQPSEDVHDCTIIVRDWDNKKIVDGCGFTNVLFAERTNKKLFKNFGAQEYICEDKSVFMKCAHENDCHISMRCPKREKTQRSLENKCCTLF